MVATMSARRTTGSRGLLVVLGLAPLMGGIAGCKTTLKNDTYVEELAVNGTTPALKGDPQVERKLATVILGSGESRGLKTYQLELRNVSEMKVDVSWTVDWFDRSGNQISPSRRTWTRVQLAPEEGVPIEIRAPSSAADSWILVPVDTRSLADTK